MAANDAKRKVEEHKNATKKEAEMLVEEVFPTKVMELSELLESDKLNLKRLDQIGVPLNIPVPDPVIIKEDGPAAKRARVEEDLPAGSRVMALPNGMSPSNRHIVEVVEIVKPHIRELIDHANKVKMWITYMIPRIEDGNNFGVSIQEDTMGEARQVESEAATFFDQISRYFLTRGKIISKVAKYPHIEDYRKTVQELDEKEFISLRFVILELRNHYASLHDIIMKNLDKIKKPRSSNTDSMY